MTQFTSLSERIKTAFLQTCGIALIAFGLASLFMFAICLHVDKVMPQYEQQAKARQEIAG